MNTEDIFKIVLINTSIIAGVGVLFLFAFKKWISSLIESYFSKSLEKEKSKFKQIESVATDYFGKEIGVYPEIIEILYRLRNELRTLLKQIESSEYVHPGQYQQCTYQLTEILFKNRIYFDEPIFKALHKIKRYSQDAFVLLNRLTRDDASDVQGMVDMLNRPRNPKWDGIDRAIIKNKYQTRIDEVFPELSNCLQEIEESYEEIIPVVKTKITTILKL